MENEICRLDIIWARQLNFWSQKKRKLDFLLNFERGSIIYIEILDAKHFELDNLHCSWDPRSTNLMLQHKTVLTPEKSNGGIIVFSRTPSVLIAQGVGIYSSCTRGRGLLWVFVLLIRRMDVEGLDLLLCNSCWIFSSKVSQSLSGVPSVEQSHILQEEEDVIWQNMCFLKTFVDFGFKCYSIYLYCLLDSSESKMGLVGCKVL